MGRTIHPSLATWLFFLIMELTWSKHDNGLLWVVVKNAKGKTVSSFYTLNVDHLDALSQSELEEQVKKGFI